MKCEHFMDLLDGFLDGSLTEKENVQMLAHLENCPACHQVYEEQKMLLEELSALDETVRAPETLIPDTMERIHRERQSHGRHGVWIGVGIAAAVCLTLGVGTLLGSGLASVGKRSAASMLTMGNDTASYAVMPEEEATMDMAEIAVETPAEAPAADTQAGTGRSLVQEDPQYGLKIIREASLSMQTENYDSDVQALEQLVESLGGYITSRSESGTDGVTYAMDSRYQSLTVRVPADKLDQMMEQVKSIGIVTDSTISETDVTDQYQDTDLRLKAYQKQYDRVLEMMDKADTVDALIQIESELSRLEVQIEECQGSLNYWDARVNYSTVNISIDEVKRAISADPSLSERMGKALADSWEQFQEGCVDLVVNTYGALPYIALWVVILGAGTGITVLVVHGVKRKKKK